jgi:hypothetical protein
VNLQEYAEVLVRHHGQVKQVRHSSMYNNIYKYIYIRYDVYMVLV